MKYFIETKQPQLIDLVYKDNGAEMKHRGTGKTTALVRLSHDYKIPIYTSKIHSSALKDREKELNLSVIIIDDLRGLNMVQYKNKNMILIDEMTDIDKIDRDRYVVIGFTNKK